MQLNDPWTLPQEQLMSYMSYFIVSLQMSTFFSICSSYLLQVSTAQVKVGFLTSSTMFLATESVISLLRISKHQFHLAVWNESFCRPLICDVTPMDSSAEDKLQNMGEIMVVPVEQTTFCSGIDSAAKSKARSDIKSSKKVWKVESRWSCSRLRIDTP